MVYFNEYDPHAAEWIRELMVDGLVPRGTVDERSIKNVAADDVRGYVQCHFFAGISGWTEALRLAGWPSDREVWTGSCPCQPYSAAGKRKGNDDERDLWPEFFRLIRECRPAVVFGEQVASSSVIGPVGEVQDVQEVQDREIVFGVLHELQRRSGVVQGVREGDGASEEAFKTKASGDRFQEVAGLEPGARPGECGEASSQEKGVTVQPGSKRHSKANRQRRVRTEWDRLRSVGAEGMERPIVGSNQPDSGVYDGQCSGGSVRTERHGEHLGSEQDFGDCVGDFSEAPGSLEFLVRAYREEVGGDDSQLWLSRIRADLEAIGYTFGACVVSAAGVGAPHIRQRLYWVAYLPQRWHPLHGGPGGLRLPESVEVEEAQEGVCVPQQSKREHLHASSDPRTGERKGDRGPHQPGQVGQPTREPSGGNAIGEQPQSGTCSEWSVQGKGTESLDRVPLDRQEVSVARIIRDKGEGDRGEGEGADGCGVDNSPDNYGVAHAISQRARNTGPGTIGEAAAGVQGENGERERVWADAWECSVARGVFHPTSNRREQGRSEPERGSIASGCSDGGLVNTNGTGPQGRGVPDGGCSGERTSGATGGETGFAAHWRDSQLIYCRDGKYRRVPALPGLQPLVAGVSGRVAVVRSGECRTPEVQGEEVRYVSRVAALRGAGNAICVQTAALFVKAFLEATGVN